jgi:late competence protein required for DNA uptake (superfamily II DNA/RNA helicase)
VRAEALAKAKEQAEAKAETEAKARAEAEEKARAEAETKLVETSGISTRTLSCECCDRNVTENQLVRIDSGQLFCPDCLETLRSSSIS